VAHRAIDGEPVPGTFAAEDELFGIGAVLGELGTGVFELAPAGVLGEDLAAPEREMAWMRRLAGVIRRPVTFALTQNNNEPDAYRKMLDLAALAAAEGVPVRPQVHGRTVALLLGLQTFHPLNFAPSWSELGLLPLAEQVARLRDGSVRARLLADMAALADDPIINGFMHPSRIFPLGDPPDYEPSAADSVAAVAAREGRSPWEVLYDSLLRDEGRELHYAPLLNYSDGTLDATLEMLTHPTSVFGLGDGGAHAGQTCDASTTTFLLSYWARDRVGEKLSVEDAVRMLTSETADLFGLRDRGRLVPGAKADLNVIDFERLHLRRPELVADLPGDATRLIQRSEGYVATVNRGVQTFDRGVDTGARPGELVRGAR
jgi:N-acyl-D-aspartate/D-glutamate deacylase